MALEYVLRGGVVALKQDGDTVLYQVQGGGFEAAPCMWFAECENMAVTTRRHPVLADVPVCLRCNAFSEGETSLW